MSKSTCILIAVFGGVLLYSCKKPVEPDKKVELGEHQVFISNEGNFGWGEGSISLYNPDKKEVQNEVYKAINGSSPGNVLQSICRADNYLYLVLNNSGKIVITDTALQKTGEINGFNSPRYMYKVADNKAYVTDLYADKIWIVNLSQASISGSIELSGWAEKAMLTGSEFWLCNEESAYVYIINALNDQVTDSVYIGFAAKSVSIDQQGTVWILSRGNGTDIKPHLYEVNSLSHEVMDSVLLAFQPMAMEYSSQSNSLYILGNDLFEYDVTGSGGLTMKLDLTLSTPYALGVSPDKGDIYISDIFDFTQRSEIHRYDKDGGKIDQFYAGIISGGFYFK